MFCSGKSLHRLINIQERYLQLKHQDYVSNFITLLVNGNEKSLQEKCLELLIIKFYKYLNDLLRQVVNDIFKLRKLTYNFIYLKAKILEQNDTVWIVLLMKLVRVCKLFLLKQQTQFC